MNCNFTTTIRDEDDVVTGLQPCADAATYHIIYIDATEAWACDAHENVAVLDAVDEFRKKKEVSSCALLGEAGDIILPAADG